MCPLCTIKEIAARDRWPKPLEHHQADLNFLVESPHDAYIVYQTAKQNKPHKEEDDPIPNNLLDLLRLLNAVLDDLDNDRQKWWTSPEKREQRRRLDEDCEGKKLAELHKINNRTVERIEGMSAKLGQFVKWSLGMNGGIGELKEGGKVLEVLD